MQYRDTGILHEGRFARKDDRVVVHRAVNEIVNERLAGYRDRLQVKQIFHLGKQRKNPTRSVEIIHEKGAARLQVRHDWHPATLCVEVIKR